MACIIGRKIGMTRSYDDAGEGLPVSVVQAGPCKVVGVRKLEKEGYQGVVVGFEEVEGAKLKNKSLLGFFKKQQTPVYKVVKEFRDETAETGADLNVSQFKPGDIVMVQGFSKGRGWTSVIKKWNFGTGRESHGGNCQRKRGSSGMHTWPAHVIKGKKMSGRWSLERVTLRSVEVIDVIPEENLLLLKGPLPGTPQSLLRIQKLGEKKVKATKKDEAA